MYDKYSENVLFSNGEYDKELKFWKRKLEGEIVCGTFSNYASKQYVNGRGYKTAGFSLNPEIAVKVNNICHNSEISIFIFLLSGVIYLLQRYTGNDDITVFIPALKINAEADRAIGFMPLRILVDRNSSFKGLLDNVKNGVKDVEQNKNLPYSKLLELLNPDTRHEMPVFNTVVMLENADNKKLLDYVESDTVFKLLLTNGRINMSIRYNDPPNEEFMIARIFSHLSILIEAVIESPDRRLSQIELLSSDEKNLILKQFNNTHKIYPQKTFVELFDEQVASSPSETALIFEGASITYAELDTRTKCLAGLLKDKGAGAGKIIAVITRRSIEMLVGIIAILKSGAAYLPVDPDYPEERVKYMLNESNTDIMLVNSCLGGMYDFKGILINLDDVSVYTNRYNYSSITIDQEDLAYVIFTSGSTGKPKGVMIGHGALYNLIEGVTDRIEFVAGNTILALTTLSFDIFVLETLLPLAKGLTVAIADEVQQRDPNELRRAIIDMKVDMLQITPSRLKILLNTEEGKSCLAHIKVIMVGGEPIPEPLLQELNSFTCAKIYNMYGPTETTVWSSIQELAGKTGSDIGKPISNTYMYILNDNYRLQPVGVAGELHISGDGLAKGYLNKPGMTSEKFISNPFMRNKLMYKTGDLARWQPDGSIEFLGRLDCQVKIRGYRVEPGEVEKLLSSHPVIKECIVDARNVNGGEKSLCAYFTAQSPVQVSELREFLMKELPDYMIPSYYVKLDAFPLTPNGKLDRRSLPEPGTYTGYVIEHIKPSNETEERLVDIWRNMLGIEHISVDDNFFNIGGNSILLAQMQARIDYLNPGLITITDLFKLNTIRKLAGFIQEKTTRSKAWELQAFLLQMPSEFFTQGYMGQSTAYLSYRLDDSMYEGLMKIANIENTGLNVVLMAAFAYLLTEISGFEKIVIQICDKWEDIVCPLNVDLANVNDFTGLIRQIAERTAINEPSDGYSCRNAKSFLGKKEINKILPLFYDGNLILNFDRLTEYYDLVLSFKEDCGVRLIFEYGINLKSDKIKELSENYFSILALVIKKYSVTQSV